MMNTLNQNDLFLALESSEYGLSEDTAHSRLLQNGRNTLPSPVSRSHSIKFLMHFIHFFALLLWVAALISFAISWADPESGMGSIGWAIVAVIIINGVFGFYQEYRTEKSLDTLRKILPLSSKVFRDEEKKEILSEELVVGDAVVLSEGDKVPADLYVIRAFDLWVNESTLTGESDAVSAGILGSDHPKNQIFSGTYVIKGEAVGIVYATGKNSRYGNIAVLTQGVEPSLGHLHKQIMQMSRMIALTSIMIAAIVIFLAQIKGFEIWKTFLFALGLLVALIPEGLLPTVTLALAFGAQRMASKKFLVNGLNVIENLGAVSVIATDKTGTITQNRMEVKIWYTPQSKNEPSQELIIGAWLCNRSKDGHGDPVELALRTFAESYPRSIDPFHNASLITEYPFDYHLKRMSTLYQTSEGIILLCKGAFEVILEQCSLFPNGDILDKARRIDLMNEHNNIARQGYRVIAFAQKKLSSTPSSREDAESQMCFIGMIGLIDPLRDDIRESIAICHKARIRVIMITGDHPITAGAIGVDAGIISHSGEVTTGEELKQLPSSVLSHLLRKNHVFARVTPEQKLDIVTHLKNIGETVAVTGDGVNDAPALKKADVGIAMGSGTDVAKQSADAILLDDHFATIVKGIEEGRTVYENIRRFITYMLSSNLPEAVPYLFFFWMGLPLALPIALVLAIDLGTDIVPGLALGAEPPHSAIMRQSPKNLKKPVLDVWVYVRAFGFLGAISSLLSMGMFWYYLHSHGWDGEKLSWNDPLYLQATTLAFATIVFAQIGNGLSCRSEKESIWTIGWFNNRYYWIGVGFEIAIMFALIFFKPIADIFNTAAFEWHYWLVASLATLIILIAEELRKLTRRKFF